MPPETLRLEDELTAALTIEDERLRVDKLLELAPALPETLLTRVLKATEEVRDQNLRAFALAELARYLNSEQLEQAFGIATRMLTSVNGPALGAIGLRMSDERRAEVIQLIQDVTPTGTSRLGAWTVLAPYLSSDLKQEAFSTAMTLTDDASRAKALTALAPHLPNVWKLKALESVRKIPDPSLKVMALSELIPALPKKEQADALNEALTLARSLTGASQQALALLSLLPLVPDDLKEDVGNDIYVRAFLATDPREQVELLIELASLQSDDKRSATLANAFSMVTEINDEETRGAALVSLAHSGFPEVQEPILKAARAIKDPQVKSSVIIQLQSMIDQAVPPPAAAPPKAPQGSDQQSDFSSSSSHFVPKTLTDLRPDPLQDPDQQLGDSYSSPEQPSGPPTESPSVVGQKLSSEDIPPLADADSPPMAVKPPGKRTPRKKPPKVEAPVIDEHDPISIDESVNTKTYLHSDRWTLDDQLNYSIYAGAIAEFILHPDTKPPLAIGILAPWGQGKTTLMKLIQNQLQLKAKQELVTTTGIVAPPLSTSVTFAYLSKWLQDPKYELGVPKLQYPTVWFNAWKYQNSEQLWAGMAYSILSQLVGQIGNQAEREKFWLALQAERVDFNAIRQDIHRMVFEGVAPWIGISIVVAVMGIVLVIVGYFAGSGIWGGSGGVVMLAGVLLPAFKWLASKSKINSKPLAGKFAQYVRQPTYEGKLGFFHEIETDVQRVFKLLIAEGKPVVVFIDDLDRCSPGTVAQVIEAMNLFLSADFPDCYFVVGMDAQVVAASMEVAYENLDKKMKSVTRSYGSLGWYFMDKFIQLQFSIPNLTPDQRGTYLTKLFGQEVERKEVLSPAELDKIEKQLEETLTNPALKTEQLPQQAVEVAKFKLQRPKVHQRLSDIVVKVSAQKLSDDNPSLQKHIERYEPFLGVSPRGIKRFSNLYRFYNLSQITRRTQGLPACSQSALARWLVIMLRWPQLVRWIQWEGEAKLSAGASALNKAEAFEAQLVKTETHSAWVKYLTDLDKDHAEWMGDKQLYEFLKTTARPSEKLSLAVETGVW